MAGSILSRRSARPRAVVLLLAFFSLVMIPVQARACQAFPTIYFWGGSISINEAGRAGLRDFAQQATARLGTIRIIRVVGHSDRTGTAAARRRVSLERARVVRDYLVQNGLPTRLIAIAGVGDAQPFAESGEGVREPQNRRVELQVEASSPGPGGRGAGACGPQQQQSAELQMSPVQLAEGMESVYISCLVQAAEHYGALAGRAGRSGSAQGDPYADCAGALQQWKDVLVRADPAGSPSTAEARIQERMVAISRQVTASYNAAYQANNYQ